MSHRLRGRPLIGSLAARSQNRLSLASWVMAAAATRIRAGSLTGAARRYDFLLAPALASSAHDGDCPGFSRALYFPSKLIVTPPLVCFCMTHPCASAEGIPEKPCQNGHPRCEQALNVRNAVDAPRVTCWTGTVDVGLRSPDTELQLGPGPAGGRRPHPPVPQRRPPE